MARSTSSGPVGPRRSSRSRIAGDRAAEGVEVVAAVERPGGGSLDRADRAADGRARALRGSSSGPSCGRRSGGSRGGRRRRGRGCGAWNSNRPGRSSAGSSASTKLVVPTTKTISSRWKPSISVRSWLTIECSTPEPVYIPRAEANESSSSKTMIAGADWRARAEDLAEVLLALADPPALQLGPGDDRHGRAERRGHRLGEQGLARPGGSPEDHPARDQGFEPRDLVGLGHGLLPREDVEDLGPQPRLDPLVAADVARRGPSRGVRACRAAWPGGAVDTHAWGRPGNPLLPGSRAAGGAGRRSRPRRIYTGPTG